MEERQMGVTGKTLGFVTSANLCSSDPQIMVPVQLGRCHRHLTCHIPVESSRCKEKSQQQSVAHTHEAGNHQPHRIDCVQLNISLLVFTLVP